MPADPVVLTGADLAVGDVARVAREAVGVALAPEARERMARARLVIQDAIDRDLPVYGVTTGVGAHKGVRVSPGDRDTFEARLLPSHRLAQGPPLAPDVVRATLVRVVNGFARGYAGVRPELADALIAALNAGRAPRVPSLGSIGATDLIVLAELAGELLEGFPLAPKETLSLISTNALSTGTAALAVHDCRALLDTALVAAALDFEAFRANLSVLHPAVAASRPHPALRAVLDDLGRLLAGSPLWEPAAARNLQDPLSFRTVAQLHAGARDALEHTQGQVVIELNASQDNPIVLADEGVAISVGNFEVAGMAAALDALRIALAPIVTTACERMLKLLDGGFSGLPTGLSADPESPEEALSELGIATTALTAEARLLAQPVSFEMTTSSIASGIEDRMTMAPLAARRLAAMVDLGQRVLAAELTVAAQAIDLRGGVVLGQGTGEAHALVRRVVAFTAAGQAVAFGAEELRELVAQARLAQPLRGARG